MRLIDADELLKSYNLENAVKYPIGDGQGYDTMMLYEIADMICDAPTVDAVEVVRCKDCKNWHSDVDWCDCHSTFINAKGEKCQPWESSEWRMFSADDYCSYGERKAE